MNDSHSTVKNKKFGIRGLCQAKGSSISISSISSNAKTPSCTSLFWFLRRSIHPYLHESQILSSNRRTWTPISFSTLFHLLLHLLLPLATDLPSSFRLFPAGTLTTPSFAASTAPIHSSGFASSLCPPATHSQLIPYKYVFFFLSLYVQLQMIQLHFFVYLWAKSKGFLPFALTVYTFSFWSREVWLTNKLLKYIVWTFAKPIWISEYIIYTLWMWISRMSFSRLVLVVLVFRT